ncbi:type II toxin-antitoxin system Phd/YefM family antitoxin [Phytomonospora sp. NPDC050363]|uniref:type II toxin-antitoxin system Phd/YefM family antitoxin n=1 Tax=Phytomonospora sp. NPDC050363 TaxID=3155642 RepID=UPI0033D19E0E
MDWQLQEAKQRLSELVRAAETDGIQYITRHGEAVVAVLSMEELAKLRHPRPTFKELLRREPFFDGLEVERSRELPREIDLGFEGDDR